MQGNFSHTASAAGLHWLAKAQACGWPGSPALRPAGAGEAPSRIQYQIRLGSGALAPQQAIHGAGLKPALEQIVPHQ